jgi:transposase
MGHWHVTTMVGSLRLGGLAAGLVFEGATDAEAFATFAEQALAPTLSPGDAVVMDNLSSHKTERVRRAVEGAGARLLFLPPYSPDLNPIEKAWSKVKALLRAAGERSKTSLWEAICTAWAAVTGSDSRGFFASCGLKVAATST